MDRFVPTSWRQAQNALSGNTIRGTTDWSGGSVISGSAAPSSVIGGSPAGPGFASITQGTMPAASSVSLQTAFGTDNEGNPIGADPYAPPQDPNYAEGEEPPRDPRAAAREERRKARLAGGGGGGGGGGFGDGTTPSGGQPTQANPGDTNLGWGTQNAWDPAYTKASEATGVPANVIKALQAKETGKFWQGEGSYGKMCPTDQGGEVLNDGMGCIALNTGIYETVANSYGLDFDRISKDPEYAIYAMGTVMQNIGNSDAGQWGGPEGQTVVEYGGWEGAAAVYFGGSLSSEFVDGNGETTSNYTKDFERYLAELGGYGQGGYGGENDPGTQDPAAMGAVAAPAPAGSMDAVSDIWGGAEVAITQPIGSNEGAIYNNNATIYDYCADMGVNGHCGVDYATEYGTTVSSPISGQVVTVGSGYFDDGTGGPGEIRLQADNGDIIIFGHMSGSNVQQGDRIEVGQPVGQTGQSDSRRESQHLHLEVRVLKQGCPAGSEDPACYSIADPNEYFGQQSQAAGSGEGLAPAPAQSDYVAPAETYVDPYAGGYVDPYANDYVSPEKEAAYAAGYA